MAERKFDRSPNSTDDEDEFDVSELEQQLEDGMKKLHIQEKEALPDEIQWTEERLKSYQEDEQILQKLKDLKLLDEEITELKNNQSTDQDNNIRIIDSLEQEYITKRNSTD
jgi:DNA repair exonuclease SbcCD ATPase subunit